MALITQTRLTMAVQNCPNVLERLAQRLYSPTFKAAVERYDADAVNDILEEALRHCLDTDSLPQGLEQYCRKFGITKDLSNLGNIARILLIDQYRDDIDQQLKKAGIARLKKQEHILSMQPLIFYGLILTGVVLLLLLAWLLIQRRSAQTGTSDNKRNGRAGHRTMTSKDRELLNLITDLAELYRATGC